MNSRARLPTSLFSLTKQQNKGGKKPNTEHVKSSLLSLYCGKTNYFPRLGRQEHH